MSDMANPDIHHHINNQMFGTPLPEGAQPLSNGSTPQIQRMAPSEGGSAPVRAPNEGGHVGALTNAPTAPAVPEASGPIAKGIESFRVGLGHAIDGAADVLLHRDNGNALTRLRE